ncbi:hypothetical protein R1sor_002342 [Riccia sorocarpa]|uniref:Prolyl 4-hydroxylase alpha subunit domain-containing protein n=1 Tax=Riccia sorocarpa TaxID=122646 RepID=A0ABD3H1N1_9MARC
MPRMRDVYMHFIRSKLTSFLISALRERMLTARFPLSWVLEAAAIMAIAPANNGGKPPDWQDFVGISTLLVINSTANFIEENNIGYAAALYTVGQKFGQYIDESVELGGGLATEYTLLIYLSGGEESCVQGKASRELLVDGETVFYNRCRVVAEVPPLAGMALFHVHGQHCMLHEARVVAKGVKYMLRSDVIFS